MENIDSLSSDYSKIFQDIASTQVNEARKSAMLAQLSTKVAASEMVAQEIASSLVNDGYEMDSTIPDDSTISFHV